MKSGEFTKSFQKFSEEKKEMKKKIENLNICNSDGENYLLINITIQDGKHLCSHLSRSCGEIIFRQTCEERLASLQLFVLSTLVLM